MTGRPSIFLTTADAERLKRVLPPTQRDAAAELLAQEIQRAHLCDPGEMPARVVRVGSRVRYRDLGSGAVREARLVLPEDADERRGRLSVLSPDGAALIGLPEDQVFGWEDSGGGLRQLKVLEVLDDFIWR